MKKTLLKVEKVSKLYGDSVKEAEKLLMSGMGKEEVLKNTGVVVAVNEVSFEVQEGEIFVLIGSSGSGKSTVLRCLNLLQRPTSGKIFFKDKQIIDFDKKQLLELRRNHMSMVFQNFGLMNHRNVLHNVAYGLEVKGVNRSERENKAMEMLELTGLKAYAFQNIDTLSGGMKQRVGLARALANDPDILLMDEAFSALDPIVRKEMQFELYDIHKKMNKTIVFVSHDIDEVFKLGYTIGVMHEGQMIQVGKPQDIVENPCNDFIKSFVGTARCSKVMSAKDIMIAPLCLIHKDDYPDYAVTMMSKSGISNAYVVGVNHSFEGVLSIYDALKAVQNKERICSYITKELLIVRDNTPISSIAAKAASNSYPAAVVDENNRLLGIVTKTALLTAMV